MHRLQDINKIPIHGIIELRHVVFTLIIDKIKPFNTYVQTKVQTCHHELII